MVRQPGAPQVHARAIGACGHGFVAEMSGDDLLGQFGPPRAAKAQQVLSTDWNYARVATTAGGTRQAIEFFADFGQDGCALTPTQERRQCGPRR